MCQLVQRGGKKKYFLKGFLDQLGCFAMTLEGQRIDPPYRERCHQRNPQKKLSGEEGMVFKNKLIELEGGI